MALWAWSDWCALMEETREAAAQRYSFQHLFICFSISDNYYYDPAMEKVCLGYCSNLIFPGFSHISAVAEL